MMEGAIVSEFCPWQPQVILLVVLEEFHQEFHFGFLPTRGRIPDMVQYRFDVKQRQHISYGCVPWGRVFWVEMVRVNFRDVNLFLFSIYQAARLVFIPLLLRTLSCYLRFNSRCGWSAFDQRLV